MIKSTNEVDIYEIDGKEQSPHAKLSVISHHNWADFVVIQLPAIHCDTVSVAAKDLETAIANARNSNRHG